MSQSKSVSLLQSALVRALLAGVVASVFVAGSAPAQTRGTAPAASTTVVASAAKGQPTGITYQQKTSYDFEDDQVDGQVIHPDMELVPGRSKKNRESLVRPRTTFQPEMLKSAESL